MQRVSVQTLTLFNGQMYIRVYWAGKIIPHSKQPQQLVTNIRVGHPHTAISIDQQQGPRSHSHSAIQSNRDRTGLNSSLCVPGAVEERDSPTLFQGFHSEGPLYPPARVSLARISHVVLRDRKEGRNRRGAGGDTGLAKRSKWNIRNITLSATPKDQPSLLTQPQHVGTGTFPAGALTGIRILSCSPSHKAGNFISAETPPPPPNPLIRSNFFDSVSSSLPYFSSWHFSHPNLYFCPLAVSPT